VSTFTEYFQSFCNLSLKLRAYGKLNLSYYYYYYYYYPSLVPVLMESDEAALLRAAKTYIVQKCGCLPASAVHVPTDGDSVVSCRFWLQRWRPKNTSMLTLQTQQWHK